MKVCACGKCHKTNHEAINKIKSLDIYFPKGDKRRGQALVLCAEAFLLGKESNSQQKNLKSLKRANQRLCKACNVQPTSNGSKTDISLDANSGSSADTRKGYIKAKEGLEKIKESKKGFGRSYGF